MSKHDIPRRPTGPQRRRHPKPKQSRGYAGESKAADSFMCDDCDVVQHGGRWYWGAPPFGEVRGGLCPACRRVRDRRPAGTIRAPSSMIDNGEDLAHLLRGIEQGEKTEHPLERIIAIETNDGELLVTTTGVHVARRITSQLERRFHRSPRIHYGDGTEMHVIWDVADTGELER